MAKLYILILAIGTILSLYIPKNEVTAKEEVVIPKEAIRLRILANSDNEKDQELKRHVRDAVNQEINQWVAELTSVDEARKLIRSRLPEIQHIAEEVVAREKSNQTVHTEFGKVEFPTKLYGQFLYPAGEYEAILITLGEGMGANWWCVLFPPLCFLDFSNGLAVKEGKKKEDTQEKSEKNQVKNQPQLKNQQVVVKQDETTKKSNDKTHSTNLEEKKENHPKPSQSKSEPVYTSEDEQPIEVRFFIKDLWNKLF
ncbi:stage II sporulation protein R [Cytobacillus sp. Hz8]|uniref:stage II sporulation protein R n=1 Tax=Cytobacillus sp. Hz8 TaxID=3347168 RepID=UPI0035D7F9EC